MSTRIGSLKAQLDLSAPGLGTQISGVGAQFQRMRGEMVSSVGTIHPALGTLTRALTGPAGLVAASVAASTAVAASFRNMMVESEQIVSAANRLNMSTEFMERLQYASERTGTSFGTVTSAWQRMQIEISKAQGGGGRASIFKQLGLDPESLRQMAPEQTFRELARSISGIDNSIDRARVQYELFGRSGIELDAVLRRTAGGLDNIAAVSEQSRLRMSALQEQWDALAHSAKVHSKEGLAWMADAMGRIATVPILRGLGMKTDMDSIWRAAEVQTKAAAAGQASITAAMEENRLAGQRLDTMQRLRREVELIRDGADAIALRDFVEAGAGFGEQAELQLLIDQRNELREAQRREAEEAARIATIEQQRIDSMRQLRDEVDRLRMGEEEWAVRLFEGEEQREARRLFREREQLREMAQMRAAGAQLPGAALRGSAEAYSAIVQQQRPDRQVQLLERGNKIAEDARRDVVRAIERIDFDAAVAQAPNN